MDLKHAGRDDFQKTKQYACRIQSFLENACLASEVDDDLLAAAQTFKKNQAKNDKERVVREARAEKLLRPVARDVQDDMHWLEKPEWQLRGGQSVGDVLFAANYVVTNPANPPEEVLWCAMLKGGMIVNHEYFVSKGTKGIAFDFMPATSVKRSVFMSPGVRRAYPRLALFVTHASSMPKSSWKILGSLEEFSEQCVKFAGTQLKQRKKFAAIAILAAAEAGAAQEENMFHKDSFATFACRMACVSKGL